MFIHFAFWIVLSLSKNTQVWHFCGLQNPEKDRQILNPIPENGRSLKMNESTLSLSHGSLLCGIYLEDDKDLVIGADDLEDFYHCFVVTPAHAHRNHIHGVFPLKYLEVGVVGLMIWRVSKW